MKKKFLLIFMVALLSFTVFAACADGNTPGGTYEYPSEINTLKAECDSDTVIDGRLTESRWQNLEWMEHTVPDVSVRVATSFSDKGIYIAAVSKDRRITYNLPYAGEDNTGIRLYIAAMDDFELKNRISAFFDCGNTPFLTGSYVHSSFVTVQGEGVNTNRSEGMTLECFFPWSEIGLEEKPENVRLTFCYKHKLSGGLYGKKKNIYPALSDGSKIAKYFIFGPSGFAESDADDAVLGDSVFGYSKSTEWKEIKEEDGSLTLKSNYTGQRISNPGGRYIFFKNAYAKSYMFSGVIKPNIDPVYGAGLNNTTPRMGLISGFDPTYGFTGAYFDLRKSYLDSGRIALGHMHYFFEKWEIASVSQFKFDTSLSADAAVAGKLNADYSNGIPFTVLKDGSTIYYFIGRGNSCYLAYIDRQDYMNGETAFGFYSYAADVDITNIEYSILDGIDGEDVANLSVSEIADKYGVYRINVEAAANGFVTADSYGGRYGTGFSISVTPASTEYVLSSLKLVSKSGETEYIDKIDSEMSGGVYRFENIREDVTVKPVFTKAETAKASGTVTVDDGGNADCEITFASKNHKSRVYKVNSVSGAYSASLPKDDYTVTVVGKYCTGATREITLDSDRVIDVEISRLAVGGAASMLFMLEDGKTIHTISANKSQNVTDIKMLANSMQLPSGKVAVGLTATNKKITGAFSDVSYTADTGEVIKKTGKKAVITGDEHVDISLTGDVSVIAAGADAGVYPSVGGYIFIEPKLDEGYALGTLSVTYGDGTAADVLPMGDKFFFYNVNNAQYTVNATSVAKASAVKVSGTVNVAEAYKYDADKNTGGDPEFYKFWIGYVARGYVPASGAIGYNELGIKFTDEAGDVYYGTIKDDYSYEAYLPEGTYSVDFFDYDHYASYVLGSKFKVGSMVTTFAKINRLEHDMQTGVSVSGAEMTLDGNLDGMSLESRYEHNASRPLMPFGNTQKMSYDAENDLYKSTNNIYLGIGNPEMMLAGKIMSGRAFTWDYHMDLMAAGLSANP